MAKLAIKKASTDVTVYLFIQNSSKTTGEGLTGLAYNTASLVAYYVRPLGSATAITLATQTVTGAHSDGGFKEVDATNMPGVYRLDLPDAVCATGVNSVVVMLKGAANMSPVLLELQLTDFDPNTAAITAAGVADAVWDEATADHTTASSFGSLDANVDAILADTGTDGVKIAGAQTVATVTNLTNLPSIPANWITAAGVATGAIDADAIASNAITSAKIATGAITNAKFASGAIDAAAIATDAIGSAEISAAAVTKIQSGLALEATLTAIKGAGWTNETLAAIDALIDAIKAKSDLIPAQPAAIGSAMTLTSAYDAAKSAASQSSVNAIPTAPLLAANYTAPDNAGITAIKAKTDNLPASPAAVGSLMGLADGAITDAKIATDALSAAKIKADAVTKIQNGLAKPGDAMTLTGAYDKAKDDVLTPLAAAKSVVDAVKAKTDNLPASPAAIGSAMTLTAAYDKAKDDVLTPLATVDGIVDAIKAKTDTIPASPAQAGEYTAAIAAIPTTPLLAANYTAPDNASISAIKAKTDTIPASPAVAGEYTASIAAIQADLDNPNQYKADVSGIPDAILAKVVVDTLTLKQVLKVLAAIEIGTTTGGGTASFTYTGKDGTTVQLTGVDEDGNRTAVVVTPGA